MHSSSNQVYIRPRQSSPSEPAVSSSSGSSPGDPDVAMDASPADDSSYDPLAHDPVPPLSTSTSSSTQIHQPLSPKTPAPPTFEAFTWGNYKPPVQKPTLNKGNGAERNVPSLLSRMGDTTNEDSYMVDAERAEDDSARRPEATRMDTDPKPLPRTGPSLLSRITGVRIPEPTTSAPTSAKQAANPQPLAAQEKPAPPSTGLGQKGRSLASRFAMGLTSNPAPPPPPPIQKLSLPVGPVLAPASSPVAAPAPVEAQGSAPSPAILTVEKNLHQPSPLTSSLPSPVPPPSSPPHIQNENTSAATPGPSVAPSALHIALPEPLPKIFQRDPFAGTAYELAKSPTHLERLMAEVVQQQNEWAEVSDMLQEDALRATEEERVPGLEEQPMQIEQEEGELLDQEEREGRMIEERHPTQTAEESRIQEHRQEEGEVTPPPPEEAERRQEDNPLLDVTLAEPSPLSSMPVPVPEAALAPLASSSLAQVPQPFASKLHGVEWLRQKHQEIIQQHQNIAAGVSDSDPSPPNRLQVSPNAAIANAKSRAIQAKANARHIPPSGSAHVGGSRTKTPSPTVWSPSRQRTSTSHTAPAPLFRGRESEVPRESQHMLNRSQLRDPSGENVTLRDNSPARSGLGAAPHQTETVVPGLSSIDSKDSLLALLIGAPQRPANPEPIVKAEVKSEEASPILPPTPLPPEHNISAQETTISSIPEVNRRIFGDGLRPLRIPRQDPSSPTRQLTTIRAEDEAPAMLSPTSSRRGPTPEHLPPPLWHSEADMEMSPEDDEPTPAPWAAHSTSQNNALPPTTMPVVSRPAHEISRSEASPNQPGQLVRQERSAVALPQDHVLRSPTATSDPRLRRPIVLQQATAHLDVNSQRRTHQPSVGRDLRLITPSSSKEAPQAPKRPAPFARRSSTTPSGAPSRDHRDQVKTPSSVNPPAKPSVNPNIHAQNELDTMLQESRPIAQNEEHASEPNLYPNPLAGRSYGPPMDRGPPSSGTEQSSNALGLVGPQDTTLHSGHPQPQPSPLPASTTHSTIVPDQGRKRGRTGDDFDHQTAELPPSKRHQTEPTVIERATEVHHQVDKSLHAKPISTGSSEFHEPREAGVSRGRGYGLTPRGPKHNVAKRGHEPVIEGRASRSGYDRDNRDTRHYEDDSDYSRHHDRFDRQVDRRPEPYESRSRRSPSDYREYDTANRGNRMSHTASRRFTPDREQHARTEPRSPRSVSERQQDGWSYRDVGRDHYYRYGDSGGPGSAGSYHAPRYDSQARSPQPRNVDIRRDEYSRYDQPHDPRRSRSPPRPHSPSLLPRAGADQYGYAYDETGAGETSSLSNQVRTPTTYSTREAGYENSHNYDDRAYDLKEEVSRGAGGSKDEAVPPSRTLGAPDLAASTPTNWPDRTADGTAYELTNAPVTPKLIQVGSPMEPGKRRPPKSPGGMRSSFDHGQARAGARQPGSIAVDPQAPQSGPGTHQGTNVVSLLGRVSDPHPSSGFSGQSLSSRLTDPASGQSLASRLQPPSGPGVRPAPTKSANAGPSLLKRMG